MKAYIICFIIALLFVYLAEKSIKAKKKKVGIILLATSLIVVCSIAGARSRDIGVDVNNYPSTAYALFTQNGLSYFEVFNRMEVEPLFLVLVDFSTIFKDFHMTLFFLELACALPIYIYAYKRRNRYSITLIVFIFLITMYAKSFNLIRQFIAISIIILSTYYFENKRYLSTYILFITAILFHFSSIACVLIYIIMYLVKNDKNKNIKRIFLLLMFVGLIVFSLGIEQIAQLLPEKYSSYINSIYNVNEFSITSLIKKLFWVIISGIVLWKSSSDEEKYKEQQVYFLLFLIDVVMYLMSIKIGPFGRMGYYFLYVAYFGMIPEIKYIFKQKKIAIGVIILILIYFWYNMTVVNYQADQTYPYESDIWNFLNENNEEEQ